MYTFISNFVCLGNFTAATSGAIICVDKNQFPGPESETISGISFGLVFALVKNIDVRTWDITMNVEENKKYFKAKRQHI